MSNDYFNPPNSVWPNGLKRDGEGYTQFNSLEEAIEHFNIKPIER